MLIIYDNVDLDSNKNSWPAYIDVGLTRKRHLWDAAVGKSIFLIQLSKTHCVNIVPIAIQASYGRINGIGKQYGRLPVSRRHF